MKDLEVASNSVASLNLEEQEDLNVVFHERLDD